MNFVLMDHYRFWWPATVRVPDPERIGQTIDQTFEIMIQPESQDAAIAADEAVDVLETIRERADHDRDRLSRLVLDWRGVVDDAGRPVPFSADTFAAALQVSWFRVAIWTAYREALSGARAGN